MNKSNLLEHLKNTYCRLKKSSTHGVGVFAIKHIPANINPFTETKKLKWYKFTIKELNQVLDKEVLKMVEDFYVIEGDFVWIPECGFDAMDISFFINHSDEPNLKVILNKETDFVSKFITLREIQKGEELTADYHTYDGSSPS